jgi:hypothetical protein
VRALLSNPTDERHSVPVTVAADGETIATRSVAVPAGGQRRLSFTHRFRTAGVHTLTVAGKERTVSVGPARPVLGVRSLQVDRPVRAGQPVSIRATVANTGGAAGTYNANLTLLGERVERKRVTVPANATRTVTFTRRLASAGQYEVGVGNRTAVVEVAPANASADRDSVAVSGPGLGPVAAILALALAAAGLARRHR